VRNATVKVNPPAASQTTFVSSKDATTVPDWKDTYYEDSTQFFRDFDSAMEERGWSLAMKPRQYAMTLKGRITTDSRFYQHLITLMDSPEARAKDRDQDYAGLAHLILEMLKEGDAGKSNQEAAVLAALKRYIKVDSISIAEHQRAAKTLWRLCELASMSKSGQDKLRIVKDSFGREMALVDVVAPDGDVTGLDDMGILWKKADKFYRAREETNRRWSAREGVPAGLALPSPAGQYTPTVAEMEAVVSNRANARVLITQALDSIEAQKRGVGGEKCIKCGGSYHRSQRVPTW
jgi:hypothetical protein